MADTSATADGTGVGKDYALLLPPIDNWVDLWLQEDVPSFDVGGFVVGNKAETASLLCKSPGVVAGKPFVDAIFDRLGCEVEWFVEDGEALDPSPKTLCATVSGPANRLLQGERMALNILARCSGIATAARAFSDLAKECGFPGKVAGTRKTTPGFRLVEKYGMLVGGVDTHRMDLSSMVMLKDNHCWSTGSITAAVEAARSAAGFSMKIEVECGSEGEAEEAIAAGADVVMLDNFEPDALKPVAQRLKEAHPHVIIEASGGIRLNTIADYFCPHVDVFSTSSLHQGTGVVDFSLKVNH